MFRDSELAMLNGKKILITGGLGFIGSNLVHKCLELGAEITVFDCLSPESGGNIFNIDDIRSNITLLNKDILEFNEISRAVVGQDIIIHCAGSTSHSKSMIKPWHDHNNNTHGMLNILESMRQNNPECKLIYLGTTTQIGKLNSKCANELHAEFPKDIYSANKSVCEKYALIYAHTYNLNITALRLSNVYGPRASIHSPDFTFNNYFIGLALQDKEITIYGSGEQLRNLIYVDDVVKAIILMALNDDSGSQVYFLVGDEHYSVKDIAQHIVRVFNKGKVKYLEWPEGKERIDVGDAVFTNKKIRKIINWKPVVNIADGLEHTKNYYLRCLDKYLF
mgnify:CR=1 FL=1